MNHELQPQTQLAEATPQMQPESQGFLQNTISRGRYVFAVGAATLLAAGAGLHGPDKAEATVVDDRPPITMNPEVEGFDAALAEDCRTNLPHATQVNSKPWESTSRFNFKIARFSNKRGIVHYDINDARACDGYGKRTAVTYMVTKKLGERVMRRGIAAIDRTHKPEIAKVRAFDLGQACSRGMIAKYVTVSNYYDYTGKTYRNVSSTQFKTINCAR